ncbi:MAG: NAD-dependent epimerase/dehydratase family protein [Candidatus Binatia bacterium]
MRRIRIALTGTLGLLGNRLASRLEDDGSCMRVVLLDLAPPAPEFRKARYYRVDLTEPSASARMAEALDRERVDVIVHLAFLQHPARNPGYAHELESLGTMYLLHALVQLGRSCIAPHLVLGSSTLVYGAGPEHPSLLSEEAPLAGRRDYSLVSGKVDAERQAERYHEAEGGAVTVLRAAPILSPGARTLAGRYLTLPAVPTILGFDPMVQALTLGDAVEAFHAAIQRAVAIGGKGPLRAFNVCADGVLPLHAAIRLCGRRPVPLLRFAAARMFDALFQVGLAIAPSAHLDYLQFPCIADGRRARAELGFAPRLSTRDALVEFARTRLLDAA